MNDSLISGLSRDYGVHAYGKWRGAFWRLISLVDLGVGRGHEAAFAAAEQTLEWLRSPNRLRAMKKRTIEGRVRRCGSQDGLALHACCRLGLADDERVAAIAESLVETQWPDGGWNCDIRPHVTHSSFNETWGPVLGLAEFGARDAAERGAEFLLRHRVVFSHRRPQTVAHPAFVKLRYPCYWHYDLLAGLMTLAAVNALADPRTEDALDLLESKRLANGTWRVEGRWWKRPGSKGSNVEAVDWETAADDLLTARAQTVLAAAGRA
jgi:hypothetical protein